MRNRFSKSAKSGEAVRRILMIPILIGGGIKSHRLCEIISLADLLPGWPTYFVLLLQEAEVKASLHMSSALLDQICGVESCWKSPVSATLNQSSICIPGFPPNTHAVCLLLPGISRILLMSFEYSSHSNWLACSFNHGEMSAYATLSAIMGSQRRRREAGGGCAGATSSATLTTPYTLTIFRQQSSALLK
jgi:hypothetical protein